MKLTKSLRCCAYAAYLSYLSRLADVSPLWLKVSTISFGGFQGEAKTIAPCLIALFAVSTSLYQLFLFSSTWILKIEKPNWFCPLPKAVSRWAAVKSPIQAGWFIPPKPRTSDATVNISAERQVIRGFGGMNHPAWIGDLTAAQRETAFGNGQNQLDFSVLRIHVDSKGKQKRLLHVWSHSLQSPLPCTNCFYFHLHEFLRPKNLTDSVHCQKRSPVGLQSSLQSKPGGSMLSVMLLGPGVTEVSAASDATVNISAERQVIRGFGGMNHPAWISKPGGSFLQNRESLVFLQIY